MPMPAGLADSNSSLATSASWHLDRVTGRICIKIQMNTMQLLDENECIVINSQHYLCMSNLCRFESLFGVHIIKEGGVILVHDAKNMKHQLAHSFSHNYCTMSKSRALLLRITTSIDILNHYERLVWMAAEIRYKNFAIGSFYRSQDMTTMQRIKSGSLFSES